MLKNTGTSRRRASANAASPHGHQSTGLSACWRKYGLGSEARRLGTKPPTQAPFKAYVQSNRVDRPSIFAWTLLAATVALLAVYGWSRWIFGVGLGLVAILAFGAWIYRLLAREMASPGPPRRMLRHRGLLASGLTACATSCLLAAALVTRHARDQWGVLYGFLALLMVAGIVAIRFAYAGGQRLEEQPESS